MPRKAIVQSQMPIAPDRALKALTQQLEGLQKLKGRNYAEAKAEETQWEHLTESIVAGAFGNPSLSLNKFYRARSAGITGMQLGSITPQRRQANFESRVQEHEAVLQSLINTLRLQLPEEEIKGVYQPGEQYAFYRDLSSLIATATQDILIVDAYLDEQVFNLYVDKVTANVTVRILSRKIGINVETVARMYARNRPLELCSSADIHDRMLFIDQRGWISGQSFKDAAGKKPTYLIELSEPLLNAARDIYNRIWATATVVIQP